MTVALSIFAATAVWPQSVKHIKPKTMTAKGTFDVKAIPQPVDDAAAGPFGRLFLEARWQEGKLYADAQRHDAKGRCLRPKCGSRS